jgi:hypothetical protein
MEKYYLMDSVDDHLERKRAALNYFLERPVRNPTRRAIDKIYIPSIFEYRQR